jgi:hypothetical protein
MLLRVFIGASLLVLAGSGCGGCDSGGFVGDAPAIDAPTPGTVTLAWTLTDVNGQPISCEQVGGNFVLLELRNRTTARGTVASFSCARGRETSPDLEPGVYDISFELRGVNLTSVTAPEQKSITVEPGRDTQLAPVIFAVDARGGLVLTLASPPRTSNCRAPPMGAGITGITITLEHVSGGCAPVVFTRARGSTMLGTYTVNCSSPQVASCIENDETLTVASMASGPYVIHVRGKIGASDCWRNDNALTVPPQGKQLVEILSLALQTGTPGC